MIVHYAGLPVLTGFDIPIIADCAHAIDTYIEYTKYGWKHISNYYDLNVFSFDSMKNIACGELGGISSTNNEYADKVKCLRYCGIQKSGLTASTDKKRWWEYECRTPFIKMLPNDISASIGIAQFKKLTLLQERRKQIWDIYNRELQDINWLLIPPCIPKHVQHSYFTYYIRVLNGKRDGLARYLLDNGIYTTVRYEPLHLMKCFKSKQSLPIAEKLNEQLLNLPLHPNLSDGELEYIIQTIKKFK
jgi:aminotransferase